MNWKTSHLCAAGIIVAANIAMLSWLFCSVADYFASSHHESPAPGFCLATNVLGEWSCAYSNSATVLRPIGFGRNGRQAAIDWTWEQYEHDQRARASWYQTE
jgi:hypothetical protein